MTPKETITMQGPVCPLPLPHKDSIVIGHGSGGRMTQDLIQRIFSPRFANPALLAGNDAARLGLPSAASLQGALAFSTDSHIVNPLFFPGGDIGRLAVNGTINDLAMCGGRPLFLSAGFIIEEGFSMEELARIIQSMKTAANEAGVSVVTGDTKVVDRGKGDKLYINTAGIGLVPEGIEINPRKAKAGDKIILNGPIGLHGIAIMSVREGLQFETKMESDCAPLNGLVETILGVSARIHVLRDPTRGGVASALNEIAESSQYGIAIDEIAIPVTDDVRAACEILGLDPLYVANEGKCLVFVAPEDADAVVKAMRRHPLGTDSVIIGNVVDAHTGRVVMKTSVGGDRIVDMVSGEQLPRIC
jgi:hydrogenase expression/formation protein HypE